MPEETVGATDKIGCTCEPCKRSRREPHNVTSGRIHEYTSTPRNGWRPRYTRVEAESGATPPTFGIELETDAPDRRMTDLADRPRVPYLVTGEPDELAARDAALALRNAWDVRNQRHRERQQRRFEAQGNMTADEAVSMSAPRGLWHAKHDGSVSGPEFASQPASLAYWRAQRPHLAGMFKALLHGGMRSHDGDRCGFHVNIGTDAFNRPGEWRPDEGHLTRFARLVTMNVRWSIRMAQRTHESARWARFDSFPDLAACERWAAELARNGHVYCSHTDVLNASHSGRVEFRLPRGTLRLDRFYAKLEWTAAMVEYTRDASNVVRPSDFMRWARESGEYPELTAMMLERFNAARFEATDAPADARESAADVRERIAAARAQSAGDQCQHTSPRSGTRCAVTRRSHGSRADGDASHDFVEVS